MTLPREMTLDFPNLSRLSLLRNNTILLRPERRAYNLNLALCSLDADGRTIGYFAVGVRRHPDVGHGDGGRLAWVGLVGRRCGWEAEEDGGCFVGSGEMVKGHVGGDGGGGFTLVAREGVVEGLEDPG